MTSPNKLPRQSKIATLILSAVMLSAFSQSSMAQTAAHQATPADTANRAHAKHGHRVEGKSEWKKKTAEYKLPEVALTKTDGTQTTLAKELADGKPVILNFVFTSCAAICPVMSQIFSTVQARLGADLDDVHMVSISIDPEQDTPERLTEYAKKFAATPNWQFYTGSQKSSIAVQKAFDTYRGDKMSHLPLTFLRGAANKPWVRIEGFAKPDEIVEEVRKLMAAG
jgi:protein SCO1